MKATEKAADASGSAGESADNQTVDEKFVDEMNNGSHSVLCEANELGVEFIEVELVAEDFEEAAIGERILLFIEVKEESRNSTYCDGAN